MQSGIRRKQSDRYGQRSGDRFLGTFQGAGELP
ncbi:hypothetical protein LINGRAPRIM_LOCUS1772 [Linum grandiflorum]